MTVHLHPNYNQAFQYHRRRPQDPLFHQDISQLLDFSFPEVRSDPISVSQLEPSHSIPGPIYQISTHPGFLYVPQAISPHLQEYLAFLALTEFASWPHVTNLGPAQPRPSQGYGVDLDKPNKLSWATLGYHYQWSTRQYISESHSVVPPILQTLAQVFASTLVSSFTASAAIVNYYSTKSTMGGHQDDLEYDFSKPVISINLGLPAIFLLGQERKDIGPVIPILVRPGDVLILGGSSRLCFHGMARIVPLELTHRSATTSPSRPFPHTNRTAMQQFLDQICHKDMENRTGHLMSDEDGEIVQRFLSNHRININIRQVLPDGFESMEHFLEQGEDNGSLVMRPYL
jgi:alkylated DNA repair protein alkB family protein 1